MKFFVTTTRKSSSLIVSNSDRIQEKQAFINKMKSSGILEQAYIKIGGGSIYILNADSFSDVRTAFRESEVSLDFDCEIREIEINNKLS